MTTSATQRVTRPAGLTILAVIFILLAIVSVLWSILVFGVGGLSWMTGTLFGAEKWQAFGGNSTWSAFVGIIAAIIQLIVAFGVLGGKRWAWFLALVAVGFTVITGVLGLFGGGFGAFICGGLGLLVPAGILFYLLKPNVRRFFAV